VAWDAVAAHVKSQATGLMEREMVPVNFVESSGGSGVFLELWWYSGDAFSFRYSS